MDERVQNNQANMSSASPTGSRFGMGKPSDSHSELIDLSEISVLIAHSDPVISAGLGVLLRRSGEFKVLSSPWKPSACRRAEEYADSADVVLADYDSAMRLTVGAAEPKGRVVILTHSDSQAKICHALAQGVRGYLLLGCGLQELVRGIRSVHAGGVAVTPRVASRIAESMNQQTLTAREQNILRQLTLGMSNKRIANQLGLAVGTVKTHIKAIFAKLGARSRGEAVAIARRRGIIPDEIEWQDACCARDSPRIENVAQGDERATRAGSAHHVRPADATAF